LASATLLAGWVGTSLEGSLSGRLAWNRGIGSAPASMVELPVIGSIYSSTNRIADGESLTIVCRDGGLGTPVVNTVILDGKVWKSSGSPEISLKINWSTGLFSGWFMNPGTQRSVSFKGALVPDFGGGGFFPSPSGNGRVELGY
jgi:hypothetical protein